MVYTIEISFSILKQQINISQTKSNIITLAQDYKCVKYYDYFEMDNINNNTKRNHNIIVINFNDENNDQMTNFTSFIKIIKRIKDIYIECIYEDIIICKLIYASPYYLKTMNKSNVILYKEFKKEEGKHTENEKMILNEIKQAKQHRANTI